MMRLLYPAIFSLCFLLCFSAAQAADGFDNNYVDIDANQLTLRINNELRAVLFGPGNKSTGSFFIPIANGSSYNLDTVTDLRLTSITSSLRSAYLDRVSSTLLYFRIYKNGVNPPSWKLISLQSQSNLSANQCFEVSQLNTWAATVSVNLLNGLTNGEYVFEFYLQSNLTDYGIEQPDPCKINAFEQCNTSEVHNGRYISSRFNTTDPMACNLAQTLSNLAVPTRIFFKIVNKPVGLHDLSEQPPALRFFPNPAVDQVTVQLPYNLGDKLFWTAVDIRGVRYALPSVSSTLPQLPVGNLPEGLYWIEVYGPDSRRLAAGRLLKRASN